MKWYERVPVMTPLRGALLYATTGVLWIVGSDRLALWITRHERALTGIQTIKGLLFVALSTALLYSVVKTQSLQLSGLNQRVQTGLQQVSILDRILRHNVRNQCSVIGGYLSEIEDDVPEGKRSDVEAIREAIDHLVTLSAKATRLSKQVSDDGVPTRQTDVGALVARIADDVAAHHPELTVDVDRPESRTSAVAPEALDWILEEVLENAVEHNDASTPRVEITVETTADDVVVTIGDNGPGLPPTERELFEETLETPLQHSQGVGLWIMRILVTQAGGTCELTDTESEGATIRLTFPKSAPATVRARRSKGLGASIEAARESESRVRAMTQLLA